MSEINPYAAPKTPIAMETEIQPGRLHEPLAVPAGNGWRWIVDGFTLFKRSPLIWIVNLVLWLAIMMVMSLIPLVSILASILYPVFLGGLMLGARAQDEGRDLEVGHLFAGFKQGTGNLLAIGGFYIVGIILLVVVGVLMVFAMGGPAMFQGMQGADAGGGQPPVPIAMFFVMFLVLLALYIPVIMALWFAPALVALNGVNAFEAIKLSFFGCLRNIVPFLLYGLAALLLGIAAIIPLLLGLLVLYPTMIASMYTAYRDIYID